MRKEATRGPSYDRFVVRTLQLVSITLHVLAAATWFGSMVFLAAVLVPALRGRETGDRAALVRVTGRRSRALVWPLYGILAATGAVQIHLRGYRWSDLTGALWQGSAGHVLGLKLTLFAITLAISALHDFVIGPQAVDGGLDRSALDRSRRLARAFGRASLLLATLLIACGVAYARGGFRP